MVPRSLPIASQPWDEEDDIQAPVPIAATALPAFRLVSSEDAVLLDCIAKKLQAMQRKEVSLAPSLATTLRGLDILLTEAPNGTQILPRRVNVAPNQGTRNETAEVMGVRKKGAKKRKNVDAYCGGETSGKSARADARVPKKPKITHLPESAPSFESEIPAVDQGFLDSAAAFDSVPQAPDSEETASSETPEMLLRRTLAMYNALFPPDAPRTTSSRPSPKPSPKRSGAEITAAKQQPSLQVAVQNNDNDRDNRPGHTSAVIGLVFNHLPPPHLLRHPAAAYPPSRAALFCRRRRRPLLRLSSSARFPQGMQYGQYNGGTSTSPYAPPPVPAPPGSEYPPAAAADWVPPPYGKEADGEATKYPPPLGPPPPGFDAT
ncbi:hypothetical protein B0H14DRAFT_3475572 [Mycena olivaceomarginata]|nr:hypothetical protein B0H14DRAFT_3475572 [Mycena olivaceomarginata]